ncbi:hypothetical protein GETHOR_05840 [Geothrix oryzae]|uniref:Lipocalin-like domain-containing protein n=1 Tax=Geothrix oryzae TaxID=2927975 RepID=A0ABM8DNH4_9BACT|nr:hypothetical protein [Geothrix oryzae]BDU68483.1 hypothetical protein GETHOR_05840 [Geothrix oryzae]
MPTHFARPAGALVLLSLAWSCGGAGDGQNAPVLTPARTLVGTWKAPLPTTVNISTDSCSNALNTMTLAGTQPWTVTFVITAGSDENHVYVQMSFTRGTYAPVSATACSNPILVPEVSPMFLTGVISSTRLTLYNGSTSAGVFNFTTDILTGTFDYTWNGIYSQREYTATNGMTLLRQ